jgi:hypothetical protein
VAANLVLRPRTERQRLLQIRHLRYLEHALDCSILEHTTRLDSKLIAISDDALIAGQTTRQKVRPPCQMASRSKPIPARTDCAAASLVNPPTQNHPREWEDATTPSIRGSGTVSQRTAAIKVQQRPREARPEQDIQADGSVKDAIHKGGNKHRPTEASTHR